MKTKKKSITARIAAHRLWKVFALFIKVRDGGKCISCGAKGLSGQRYNAGHFFSAGRYPVIRYDEHNVNGQCARCNCFLAGNFAEYLPGFIEKYGEEEYDRLTGIRNEVRQWRVHELLEMEQKYKEKLAELTAEKKHAKISRSKP